LVLVYRERRAGRGGSGLVAGFRESAGTSTVEESGYTTVVVIWEFSLVYRENRTR